MPTYLVTGAAGFIGASVSEALLDRGDVVVGIDNLDDAYDVRLKLWRLSTLTKRAAFHFVNADICLPIDQVAALVREHRPAALINLSARAGARASVQDPWVYFDVNTKGTVNLLELCRRLSIPKIVLASSSSLYGKSPVRPSREGQETLPISPYAASKKAAEEICHVYHHLYGLNVTVLRYFTVYGPAGRPDMAPFRFVQWVVEEKPVLISGDGRQQRDFTFIGDVAEATIKSLPLPGYEVLNVGSDHPTDLLTFVKRIELSAGKTARLQFGPRHPADVEATWADISKARERLGWAPRTTLEEGVRRMTEWYVANRDWARDIATS